MKTGREMTGRGGGRGRGGREGGERCSVVLALSVFHLFILFSGTCVLSVIGEQSPIHAVRIGAILSSEEEALALRLAVDYVNSEQLMGPGVHLETIVNRSGVISAFSSMQCACYQASVGVMAYVGPMSSTTVQAVAPLSRAMWIPLIAPIATNPLLGITAKYPYVVRMVPPDTQQSMALISLMEAFHWSRFAILTSNTDYGVNGLLKFQTEAVRRKWKIMSVQHFNTVSPLNATTAVKQLDIIRTTGVRVVLLNCLSVYSLSVLKEAKALGMLDAGWAWVVTDGLAGQQDDLPMGFTGLLGTRPASGQGQLWPTFARLLEDADPSVYSGTDLVLKQYTTSIINSVLTFAYALRDMQETIPITDILQQPLDCLNQTWPHGRKLLQYLKKVKGRGVAIDIELNENGSPRFPIYEIVNLHSEGWIKVGRWEAEHGIVGGLDMDNITLLGGHTSITDYVSKLVNRTLRVVILPENPFVRFTSTEYDPQDIKPWEVEGLTIDVLDKLADMIGFHYTMYVVEDGQYGRKDPHTFQWDGLIGQLVQRKADLVVAPLTINYPREKDIDFTKPYLDLGMRFIMRVPDVEPIRPFRFLDPFQEDVWTMTLLMTFVVGLYVSVLNKLSPYDHHGRYVYRDYAEAEKVMNQNVLAYYKGYKRMAHIKREAVSVFSFSNSVWFSIATLLHQGGEAYPRSCSARVAMLTWLFAIVIIVATYTANLAAFLTASRSKTTIQSIEDLGDQSKVKYGTVSSSAPQQFFEDSNVTLYKDMLTYMTQQKTFVNISHIGIQKAREEDYAFIFDSAVLDYVVERAPCGTLRNVGRLFGKIGYGLGLQKSSPYKQELSYYILRLREEGYIDHLVNKWYREKGECSKDNEGRSEHEKAIEAAGGKLGVNDMSGVFIIVAGGICVSVIVLIMEWIVAVDSAVDKKDSLRPSTFLKSLHQRQAALLADLREESQFARWKPRDKDGPNRNRGQHRSHPIYPNGAVANLTLASKQQEDIIQSLAGSLAQQQRSEIVKQVEFLKMAERLHDMKLHSASASETQSHSLYLDTAGGIDNKYKTYTNHAYLVDSDEHKYGELTIPDYKRKAIKRTTSGSRESSYDHSERHSQHGQSLHLIRNI